MAHLARKKRQSRVANVLRRIRIFSNWYKVVLPFNRLLSGEQVLHVRNKMSVHVRGVTTSDLNVVMDVVGDNEYRFGSFTLPENAFVVDLGANIGTFALMVHRYHPTARIICYEPHPENFKILQLNTPPNTQLVEAAAAGETGTVRIEDGTNFVGLRTVLKGGIMVPSRSFDDIIGPYSKVNLLKVDIEGSEYELLDAASPEQLAKVDRIIIETHDRPNFDDVTWAENLLQRNGFRTEWIDEGLVTGYRVSRPRLF